MATRWGLVSVGKISHDFATALRSFSKEDHIVVAVAARDLKRAQEFAKLHDAGTAYGSYEELAKDSDVEIVYIGALNPQHLEIARMMLTNGKHVLCEKPMTLNLKQTTELIKFAEDKGLFLMEGLWSRCFPTYEWLKKHIDDGGLGDVMHALVPFGFNFVSIDRLNQKDLGGGTVLDLGVYAIQFALYVFDDEKPISIKASGHLNEDGVDTSMTAILQFKNGRSATLLTHSAVNLPDEAFVIGTKGTLRVPHISCPTRIVGSSGDVFSISLPKPAFPLHFPGSMGLRFEAAEVRRCLQAGLKESPVASHAKSLLIAEIQDEIRRQIGVVYDVD